MILEDPMRRAIAVAGLTLALTLACGGPPPDRPAGAAAGADRNLRMEAPGQPFRAGDFSYTIQSWLTTQSVGSGHLAHAAPEGATFVAVGYNVRNDGQRTATVSASSGIGLIDAQGRNFRADSRAMTTASMASDDVDYILRELQPGLARDSIVIFAVPEDALDGPMEIEVRESTFSPRRVRVPLSDEIREAL